MNNDNQIVKLIDLRAYLHRTKAKKIKESPRQLFAFSFTRSEDGLTISFVSVTFYKMTKVK